MSGTLDLGTRRGSMKVYVVKGEPWWHGRLLSKRNPDGTTTVASWPAAPVLEFENGTVVTATLSDDSETSTPNARASWSMTAEQTDEFYTHLNANLKLQGSSLYIGEVVCQ